MSVGHIISCAADVEEGAAWLARAEPRFEQALKIAGPLPLRRKPDGFAELLSAIVSQQVSVASAKAIWARSPSPAMRCATAKAAAQNTARPAARKISAKGAIQP